MCRRQYNQFTWFVVIVGLVFSITRLAASEKLRKIDTDGLQVCANACFSANNDEKVYFWQHLFEDGVRDLVVTDPESGDIKRVTFSKNKTKNCQYQVLAITEGIGWGWHLAWADSNKLYIARMDGKAWVSSIPKKIASKDVTNLHFTQKSSLLIVYWTTAHGESFYIESDDDGRNWSTPNTHMKN